MTAMMTASPLVLATTPTITFAASRKSLTGNLKKASKLEDKLDDLQDKVDSLQKDKDNAKKKQKSSQDSMKQKQKEYKKKKQETAKSQGKYANLVREQYMAGNQSDLSALLTSNGAAEAINQQELIHQSTKKAKNLTNKMSQQKSQLQSLADSIQNDQTVVAKQGKVIRNANKQLDDLNQQIKDAEHENNKLQKEIKADMQTDSSVLTSQDWNKYGDIIDKATGYDAEPDISKSCYHSKNPYTYGMPNCTTYVWGREYETSDGEIVLPRLPAGCGNANRWYSGYGRYYKHSSRPVAGAIACWSGGRAGHVAFIERVNSDGSMVMTESGRTLARMYGKQVITKTMTPAKMRSYVGGFQGYLIPRAL